MVSSKQERAFMLTADDDEVNDNLKRQQKHEEDLKSKCKRTQRTNKVDPLIPLTVNVNPAVSVFECFSIMKLFDFLAK